MMQVPEAQFNQLVAEMKQLKEKLDNKGIRHPKRITDHVARLREWEGELVVGFSPVRSDKNKDLVWDITLGNGKSMTVGYLKLLNEALPVQVKILKQEATVDEKIVETNFKRDPQHGDTPTGEMIDYVVTTVDYVSTIEVIEGTHAGEKITLNNKFINL